MAMTLYEEAFGHLAKRPRVDYNTNSLERQLGYPFLLPPQLVEIQLAKKPVEEHPNHVLLYTVLNPLHNITCEVLHTISSPFGKVMRMVIFKKNGVQAMLEFDSVDSAQRAKENLHGCDIYSGCCTLKIEYAKPTKLNVYKNDSESYDFTNPGLGAAAGGQLVEQTCLALASHRPVLLKDPLMAGADPGGAAAAAAAAAVGPLAVAIRPTHHQVYASPAHHQVAVSLGASGSPINFSSLLTQTLPRLTSPGQLVTAAGSLMASNGCPQPAAPLVSPQSAAGAAGSLQPQGSVTMVYGLNCAKMSCTRIFNLFCLYGNVVRVKFLKTKEGCAMVQMGDTLAVERAVSNLNNMTFFQSKMQLGFSKQVRSEPGLTKLAKFYIMLQ
jgi:heterogeneous nuclear ribonucleoprotein L